MIVKQAISWSNLLVEKNRMIPLYSKQNILDGDYEKDKQKPELKTIR